MFFLEVLALLLNYFPHVLLGLMFIIFVIGVHGDSLTILQAPEFVSFQKGDWPVSGEKIPDLVALTMGFSVQEVLYYLTECSLIFILICKAV